MKRRLLTLLIAFVLLLNVFQSGVLTVRADSNGENDIPSPPDEWADADICRYPIEGGFLYFDRNSGTILYCSQTATSVIIPPEIDGIAVVAIGDNAFHECELLAELALPDSLQSIGHYAFFGCTALTEVQLPPDITEIPLGTFYGCTGLREMYIPEGVTALGDYAFWCCSSMENIWLPATVERLGNQVFYECYNLEGIWVDEDNPTYSSDINGVLFNHDMTELIQAPDGISGDYILPDGVERIDLFAFSFCRELSTVTFPESLEFIGYQAFSWCDALVGAYFHGDAPRIGGDIFHGCDLDVLTVYYDESKEGWTTPKWCGYHSEIWIPLHSHNYVQQVTVPTCTEGGYTVYLCDCGEYYVSDHTEALGHNYVVGTCSRCGEKDPDYVPPVSFSDVSESAWYATSVNYAVAHGLMNGMGGNQFEPNTSMTRGMLVTVLWRYAGEPKEGSNDFSDVPSGQWYAEAVAWAAHNGIVTGVGNGRFDPNGTITREQLATILFRYCNAEGLDTSGRTELGSFPDKGKISAYAEDALSWAVSEGLVTGTKTGSSTYLDPKGNATRAQVATILMRFIENVVE